MNNHELYKTGDADAPTQVKDRNGEVVLDVCRLCGQGEADLAPTCPRPRMKTYIAGPMTGIPDHNFPAFNAEAARQRALGHLVVNPAELEQNVGEALAPGATLAQTNERWVKCMRVDIATIMQECDRMVMLPGWQRSKGAQLERLLAVELGFEVVYPLEGGQPR